MNNQMVEEVEELKAFYESKGENEKAQECNELLELYYAMKLSFSEWKAFKRLAEENRRRTEIGEFAMYQ